MDLRKAFDSVNRKTLINYLESRANSDIEKHVVFLISSLLRNNKGYFGEKEIKINSGVPQGGILSPMLFNSYLENCIDSEPLLKTLTEEGNLLAFADDLIVISET